MNDRKIIVIPRSVKPPIDIATGERRKKRVTAYARVSTDMEDQKNSLETQKNEYTKRIKENPNWEFVELYFDEGITGTNTKKRDGFNRMIKDALNGKIDLILVKSISRFARNTVDCIATKRALQDKGVEIFFEKENISSLDSSSETMLTIYASFAQEESRQISTNVTWGIRSKMKQGSYNGYSKKILGYKKGENGNLEIDEEGKKTVLLVFEMFTDGYSYREIIDTLIRENKKNAKGEVKWDVGSIHRILTNEKYCGDLIYQKTYCNNYLTHERRKNDGEVDQYLIPEHHEPIIEKDLFMFVQLLLKERKKNYNPRKSNRNTTPLTGLIYCAACNRPMRRILYYKGKPYERHVLTCKVEGRKNINYSECPQKETLDYSLVEKTASIILKEKLEKLNKDVLMNGIAKGKLISDFITLSESLNEKLKTLKTESRNLIQNQASAPLPLALYQEKFMEIENKKKELKDKQKHLIKEALDNSEKEKNNKDLAGFLGKKSTFTADIASTFIKRIYRLIDNSVLFIISQNEVTEDQFKELLNNKEITQNLTRKTIEENGRILIYMTLEL